MKCYGDLPTVFSFKKISESSKDTKAPFACLKFGLFGLFFQPEQCFSLTTIQPEQCFQPVSARIQTSERGRSPPMRSGTNSVENQYGEPVALRVQSMSNKKLNLSFTSLFVYPSLP